MMGLPESWRGRNGGARPSDGAVPCGRPWWPSLRAPTDGGRRAASAGSDRLVSLSLSRPEATATTMATAKAMALAMATPTRMEMWIANRQDWRLVWWSLWYWLTSASCRASGTGDSPCREPMMDPGMQRALGPGPRRREGSSPSPALGDDAEEEEKEKEEEEEEGAVEQAEEEGRGGGGGEDGGTPHSDSEEEEEAVAAVLDEGIAQLREDKALERNRAVRRILAPSTKTLKDALGLREVTSNKEMAARIRKLLRLLHPDFAINLALKGTEEHERIDAAFKKLNNLRL